MKLKLSVIGHGDKTYRKANKSCDELIDEHTESKMFGFFRKRKRKSTSYQVLDSKNAYKSNKPQQVHVSSLQLKYALQRKFSKAVCSVFKLNYSQIENFYKNAKLLTNRNTFWVLQNADLIIQLLNNISKRVCQIYSKM